MRARELLSVAAVGVILAVVMPAAPASAHADYRDSDPPDGASVAGPPNEVWAEFTEQPVEGSTLVVTDPCGQRVDNGDYRYQPFPINRITVSLSADKAGGYRVTWTVTSDADGHTTRGTFTFVSNSGAPCPGDEDTSDGSADESAKSSGGTTSARRPAASGGNDESAASGTGDGSEATAGSSRKRTSKATGRKTPRFRSGPAGFAQTPTGDEEAAADPEEEDIPMDWLVVGLAIAALIGAAGGRVYVNITAPPR
jgi:methionine-rich copper-binding protein CopC